MRTLGILLASVVLLICAYACADTLRLPASLTEIGKEAFYGDTSLGEVIIPDGAVSIGKKAFAGSSVTNVVIPASVTSIADDAFEGCAGVTLTVVQGSRAESFAAANGIPRAVTGECGKGLSWVLSTDGTLTVTGSGAMADWGLKWDQELNESSELLPPWNDYRSAITSVVIGYGVTGIGDCAFKNCGSLAEIAVPDSVARIGIQAFCGCESLESAAIPDSVTYTGTAAFYGCPKLADKNGLIIVRGVLYQCVSDAAGVTVPGSVSAIDQWAFSNCTGLVSVTIPGSVRLIDTGTFCNCTSLESVVIPDSVTSIMDGAFYNCTALESVTIPDSVTFIGNQAFANCSGVTIYCGAFSCARSYAISNGISYAIGETTVFPSGTCGKNLSWALSSGGVLTITGTGVMDNFAMITDGEPGDVSPAPWKDYRELITSAVIAEGAQSIGVCAFEGCVNLASADIPDSVTRILSEAFYGCTSLESIAIADSVTEIGTGAFYNCPKLADENGLIIEGGILFQCVSDAAGVTVPGSVTVIDREAFRNRASLESVTIPDSVCYIGDDAFANCPNLTIYCGAGSCAESYAKVNGISCITDEPEELAWGTCGESLSWILYADGVLTITGTGWMDDYGVFTDEETDEDIVVNPPWNEYKAGISSVVIGDGVTTIGSCAFDGCTGLASAVIPYSVSDIGDDAFANCPKLTIHCGAFSYAKSYAEENGISCEAEMPAVLPSGSCGENLSWALSAECVLTITGTGAMEDYGYIWNEEAGDTVEAPAPWQNYKTAISSVVIGDGVTTIGENAFGYCHSLANATLSATVTVIGDSAFSGCESLEGILIPGPVTSIGNEAFMGCMSLESVSIPGTVTTIGTMAFYGCTNLGSVTIPDSAAAIGSRAFFGCDGLADANGLIIVRGVLYQCVSDAASVTIPDSVAVIGTRAFEYDRSLVSVTVPSSVTSIDMYAFNGCANLESAVIPGSVASIGSRAFARCPKLTIYCPAGSCAQSYAAGNKINCVAG